jgi:lipopolysaccharide export system permease protein
VRLLDKYLLREFVLPWVYSFDAFVTVLLVDELLRHLDDFIRAKLPAALTCQYFINYLPGIFVQVLPMSLLLGVLFALTRLGKHNELQAMRASGISLARLSVPLLLAGLFATAVTAVLQETLLIPSRERAAALLDRTNASRQPQSKINNFFYANLAGNREWYAREFDIPASALHNVELQQRNPQGFTILELFAGHVAWRSNRWEFADVTLYDYRTNPPQVGRVAETNFPFINDSIRLMAVEGRNPDQLSTKTLRRHVQRLRQVHRDMETAPYEATLHYRYAYPWSCLVVAFLAVPLGMQVSHRGPMLAIASALVLVVAFYLLTSFALIFGMGGQLPPLWAAWTPNIVFGGVGLVLFWRLR